MAEASTPTKESLVVLMYQTTRKMVTVTTVQSAIKKANDIFDLEEAGLILQYLGADVTWGVKLELLPAVAELQVVVK